MDMNWQTELRGFYAAGEAAGTFGVYRPGGSALNSAQVGSLRAAEHIAKQPDRAAQPPEYRLPELKYGTSNLAKIRDRFQTEMSRAADFDRSTEDMKKLLSEVNGLCDGFFDTVTISDASQTAEAFRLYDMALTQRAVLSAMICSAEHIGTHGSAHVDKAPDRSGGAPRTTRTVTTGAVSEMRAVSAMPDPELWFETLLARKKKEIQG